jgi:hypothetical protein
MLILRINIDKEICIIGKSNNSSFELLTSNEMKQYKDIGFDVNKFYGCIIQIIVKNINKQFTFTSYDRYMKLYEYENQNYSFGFNPHEVIIKNNEVTLK